MNGRLYQLIDGSLLSINHWFRLIIEGTGAIWIATGFCYAAVQLVSLHVRKQASTFLPVRITFTRYLSLGLEFQLAADILSTAISPSWNELGKLGATATIRTTLNYFLSRDAREYGERREHEKELVHTRQTESNYE
jgi:uncharacterized membrane protein